MLKPRRSTQRWDLDEELVAVKPTAGPKKKRRKSGAQRAKELVGQGFLEGGKQVVVMAVKQRRGSKKTDREGGYYLCVVVPKSVAITAGSCTFEEAQELEQMSVKRVEDVLKLIRQQNAAARRGGGGGGMSSSSSSTNSSSSDDSSSDEEESGEEAAAGGMQGSKGEWDGEKEGQGEGAEEERLGREEEEDDGAGEGGGTTEGGNVGKRRQRRWGKRSERRSGGPRRGAGQGARRPTSHRLPNNCEGRSWRWP